MSDWVDKCPDCGGRQTIIASDKQTEVPCEKCNGKGYLYVKCLRVPYSSHKIKPRQYLKPWKDPQSLFCSEKLGEILKKELLTGDECRDEKE
jgi:hypothetical protein